MSADTKEWWKGFAIAFCMIAAVVILYCIYTLSAVYVLNSIFLSKPGLQPTKYCYKWLQGQGSDAACQQFGGVKLLQWETECQPDPDCTKFPDGTDYTK